MSDFDNSFYNKVREILGYQADSVKIQGKKSNRYWDGIFLERVRITNNYEKIFHCFPRYFLPYEVRAIKNTRKKYELFKTWGFIHGYQIGLKYSIGYVLTINDKLFFTKIINEELNGNLIKRLERGLNKAILEQTMNPVEF